MRKTKGWTGLRSAVIALGLVAWTATGAMAAACKFDAFLHHVGPDRSDQRRHGHQRDQLRPLHSSNSVDLSSGTTNAGLGNFVISPLAAGTSTTYKNTPFQISFLPASYQQ